MMWWRSALCEKAHEARKAASTKHDTSVIYEERLQWQEEEREEKALAKAEVRREMLWRLCVLSCALVFVVVVMG